ncbi:hypothetical protein MKZ38_000258 [Zalerion maritima]|uniref:Ankyrin repeat protein n=1 Tax=Zalerion maritima TaxID=339359 RepID=A0AAD5RT23_9PEZI|nr:hypothetical protein MKZ38_000258 [Zalerion maritima]
MMNQVHLGLVAALLAPEHQPRDGIINALLELHYPLSLSSLFQALGTHSHAQAYFHRLLIEAARYEKLDAFRNFINLGANAATPLRLCQVELSGFYASWFTAPTKIALHVAVEAGKPEIIQALLESGDMGIARFLLERGASINSWTEWYGSSALEAAAKHGHIDRVQVLVSSGNDVSSSASENAIRLLERHYKRNAQKVQENFLSLRETQWRLYSDGGMVSVI